MANRVLIFCFYCCIIYFIVFFLLFYFSFLYIFFFLKCFSEGMTGVAVPAELLENAEMPKLVIVGIALAALGLLLANAALVAWFIVRKRNKGLF